MIDLPLLGERYVARAGSGASLNGRPTRVIEKGGLHEAIVGFADFAVGPAAKVENRVHRELMDRLVPRCLRVRVHGSEILDLAWLAAGHLDVSVMLSSLPWDVTAGVLIAREAGAEAFDQRWIFVVLPLDRHDLLDAGRRARALPHRSGGGRSRGRRRPNPRRQTEADQSGPARQRLVTSRRWPVPSPCLATFRAPAATPSFTATSDRQPAPHADADPGEHGVPRAVFIDGCEVRAVHFQLPLVGQQDRRLRGSRYEDARWRPPRGARERR